MSLTIGTAVLAGGVLTAGASLYGASKAGQAQQNATNAADQTQLDMYNQTRADNAPALGVRNDALARLEELLGISKNTSAGGYGSAAGPLNVGDVTQDPGYAFGMQQGQNALNNSLNARGMRDSGAALKAAARYGNDYGTTKYDDAFNRAQTNRQLTLNPLQSLAGLGQTGASTIAQAGSNYANQVGANQSALGNAMGANYMGQANIISNGVNQLSGWYQNQNRGGGGWGSPVSTGSMYGGGGSGYYDQNGSDLGGWHP